MSDSLTFHVPGEPVAKGRPRIGKNRHTGRPVNLTPDETRRFESLVKHEAWLAMRAAGLPVLDGAVLLEVDAFFAPRKSDTHTAPVRKTTKPDSSNVAKAVEDAMNSIVFTDDARIFELRSRKWWQARGAPSGTLVKVTSLDGEWGS